MGADGAAQGRVSRRARELEELTGRPIAEVLPRISVQVQKLETQFQQPITRILLEVVWLQHHGDLRKAGEELGVKHKTLNQWLIQLGLSEHELALRQARALSRAEG